MEECKVASVPCCKCAKLQVWKVAIVESCKCGKLQGYKVASVQSCKGTKLQMCKNVIVQSLSAQCCKGAKVQGFDIMVIQNCMVVRFKAPSNLAGSDEDYLSLTHNATMQRKNGLGKFVMLNDESIKPNMSNNKHNVSFFIC